MSYRKNEGRYARMVAFWALFLLVGYGCFAGNGLEQQLNKWLGDANSTLIDPFPILDTLRVSTCIALGFWLFVGFILSRLLNRPKAADMLIETESEMQKVTWPTWSETWQGTLAVAAMVGVLFVFLFVADLGLAKLMTMLLGGRAA